MITAITTEQTVRRQFSLADLFLSTALCALAIAGVRQGFVPLIIVGFLVWPIVPSGMLLLKSKRSAAARIQMHGMAVSVIVIGYIAAYEFSAIGYLVYYLLGWHFAFVALNKKARRQE